MAYGLKYQTQFSSISDDNNPERLYTLQFWFKGYAGGPATIQGAGVTVEQKCTNDDPVAPVKGQYLDISLVNDGNIPISSFQSEDDDGVQVRLLDESTNIVFIGFLVQDDFGEIMLDPGHVINLTANDGLGLLKEVTLQNADVRRKFYSVRQTNGVNTVVYVYVADTAFYPQAGDIIEFIGSSYTISTAVKETTVISSIVYNWTITLTTDTGGIAYGDEYIYLTGEVNLTERNSLLSMIAVCLAQTGIPLVTNVFMNLYEYRQDNTRSCLPQTLISSQTFITGDSYQDCYEVLTNILSTFKCTLFQANGQWHIINWLESKQYTGYTMPGFVFDETWAEVGTTTFGNILQIGPAEETQHVFPLNITSYRGWKYSKKKFSYNSTKYLIFNADLQELGALIRTYQDAGNDIYEYELPYWQDSDINTSQGDRYIRVIKDLSGVELDRYIVITGGTPPLFSAFMTKSNDIEVRQGDIVEISFSYRTAASQSVSGTSYQEFGVRVYDGTLSYWARNRYVTISPLSITELHPPVWDIQNSWPTSDINRLWGNAFTGNTNEWITVSIKTGSVPVDGILSLFLANQDNITPLWETRYKNLTLRIIPAIRDSINITGHTHKQEQVSSKKNNQDIDIYIDDAPRSSISGVLYLPTKTGVIQDLTAIWRYPPDASGWKLGERSTLQELTWRQMTRTKYTAEFTGLWQNGLPVSLLSLARMAFNPTKIFTFGTLTINYRDNSYSATLWELSDESDPEFDPDYEFKYLYSTT